MNRFHYSGRAAAAPELQTVGQNDTKLARVRLIRNEYAGNDGDGGRRERQVSIQFTAFGSMAETLARNVLTGDQLSVIATLRNNNFQRDGQDHYEYNFEILEFEYGAPGAEKRAKLAERDTSRD